MQADRRCPPIFTERKKNLYMWMTEREAEKSYWSHTVSAWWELFCVTDSVGLSLKPYILLLIFFFFLVHFFLFSYLHLIAYFFLYLFACARTYAHVMYMSLNVIQYLDILMPNFFLCLEEKRSWKNLCSNIQLKNMQSPPMSLRKTFIWRCKDVLCTFLSITT